MANNISILDAASATQTVKTTETAGVHVPHHNVDSCALPTGAATAAKQDTGNGVLATIDADTGNIATSAASIDGKMTACNTGAVVVSSSALPSGAATAAKQPALGTAGTASADVISVQGIASMTPIQVGDNSGSLTVDAPVGTPVFVRLSDGSSAIATLPVSLASVPSHAVTNAGVFAVQVDGNALTALQLIDDPVFADDAAFTPGTSKVMVAGFQADESSTDSVDEGDAGAARMTLDRKQIVTCQPHTAGGLSVFRSLDLDETEEEVKGSAGCLYKLRLTNFSTSPRYCKLYNADAAGTTVGSTTPIDTIVIPGATSASQPTVITENFGGLGLAFSSGLCLAATTALADADTGAPGGNEVVATAYYK